MTHVLEDTAKRNPTKTFEDATPYLQDPATLRAKADRDGYLFFKGLIPRDTVLEVRRQILDILDRRGYLDKNFPFMEGVADLTAVHQLTKEDVHGVGIPQEVYTEVQKLEAFHALAHEPALLNLYEWLFGEKSFPHPRNVGRIMLPHKELSPTPAHQDHLLFQGALQTWTGWMPLGDAPRNVGPLAVLEGSHTAGLLGVTQAPGAGGLESILCGFNNEWVTGDYDAGDFLTFHSLTAHRSLPNQTKGNVRLSIDMRFQPVSVEINEYSLLPHFPPGTGIEWKELYEGWRRTDLMYYWKDFNLKVTPYDTSILRFEDKPC